MHTSRKRVPTGPGLKRSPAAVSNSVFSTFDGAKATQPAQVRRAERSRIARELHDSTSQLLVVLELQIIRLKQLTDDSKVQGLLGQMGDVLDDLHQEIREIAHPATPAGRHGTLRAALEAMATQFSERTSIHVAVTGQRSVLPLSGDGREALYRIAQEALANAQRHGHAHTVRLRVSTRADSVVLAIADDGLGRAAPGAVVERRGTGLRHIEERAREVGGQVITRRNAKGSLLVVAVPCAQAAHIAA
jgi:signal transduction histidine kinase